MNTRERFLATLTFEECDRPLLWEFGYWTGTLRKWYKEGLEKVRGILPESAVDGETCTGEIDPSPELDHPMDEDVHNFFGFDPGIKKVPIECWAYPPFKKEILEENAESVVYRDEMGITKRERKDGMSMPAFIDWPISSEKDFELLTPRFDHRNEERLSANWKEATKKYIEEDHIVAMGGLPFGIFGGLRYLFGLERLCTEIYDNPAFVQGVANFLTEFWMNLFSKVLQETNVDVAWFWEDMSYKAGPIISPEHFKKFCLPSYRKLTSFFRDFGVRVLVVDTDGDCTKLIPLFLEGGINTILPFEVQSNMDIVKIRKQFPRLGIIGGLDKRNIARGKVYIDQELKYKLPIMFEHGGYIACADHLIPPDVSWADFCHYRNTIREYVVHFRREVTKR